MSKLSPLARSKDFEMLDVKDTVQDPIELDLDDVSQVLSHTEDLISEFGPRIAGTNPDIAVANQLYESFNKSCDSAHKEPFQFARNAFLAFMKILAMSYVIAFVTFLIGGYWNIIGIIAMIIGSIVAVEEFVLYHHTFDRFFKHYTGYNVYGVIEPKQKPRKTVIISAHHDSAYIFNYFKSHQKWYGPRIFLGLLFYHLLELSLIIPLIFGYGWFDQSIMKIIILIGFIISIPFIGPFYFFRGNEGSPGAGDNLVASSLLLKIAEKYSAYKNKTGGLDSTRVIFLSTDAEESGIRGSDAFVKEHSKKLQEQETYVINLESLYSLEHLSLLSEDINQTVELSPDLTKLCQNIGKSFGYNLPIKPIAWGGGSTDAGAFAKAGIPATTILGMENATIRNGLVYHTKQDTIDKVKADGLFASSKIIIRAISLLDHL